MLCNLDYTAVQEQINGNAIENIFLILNLQKKSYWEVSNQTEVETSKAVSEYNP